MEDNPFYGNFFHRHRSSFRETTAGITDTGHIPFVRDYDVCLLRVFIHTFAKCHISARTFFTVKLGRIRAN